MFPSQKFEGQEIEVTPPRASMEPGCFDPRNTELANVSLAQAQLQWGRDVSIPEIRGTRRAQWVCGCFNGAGMFPSQKSSQYRSYPRQLYASMGPGCFHPRNTSSPYELRMGRRASMGPGCFHPRNLVVFTGTTKVRVGFNGAGM